MATKKGQTAEPLFVPSATLAFNPLIDHYESTSASTLEISKQQNFPRKCKCLALAEEGINDI